MNGIDTVTSYSLSTIGWIVYIHVVCCMHIMHKIYVLFHSHYSISVTVLNLFLLTLSDTVS